jgi:hypothetical protein
VNDWSVHDFTVNTSKLVIYSCQHTKTHNWLNLNFGNVTCSPPPIPKRTVPPPPGVSEKPTKLHNADLKIKLGKTYGAHPYTLGQLMSQFTGQKKLLSPGNCSQKKRRTTPPLEVLCASLLYTKYCPLNKYCVYLWFIQRRRKQLEICSVD